MTDDDTRYNAMRYVQNVLGDHSDLLVLTLGTALSEPRLAKMGFLYPNFHVAPRTAKEDQNFLKRVMLPNRDTHTFYFTPHVNFPGFHTRYLGLGRALEAHGGVDVDDASYARLTPRTYAKADDWTPEDEDTRGLLRDYCDYHAASARFAKDAQTAQKALERGFIHEPQCRLVLLRLCEGQPNATDCHARLARIVELEGAP